jgi:hypothetical protein
VLWGVIDPVSMKTTIALGWENFWVAFGPLIDFLIQLGVLAAIAVFLYKKTFGSKTRS